jgi:hypothetical protein
MKPGAVQQPGRAFLCQVRHLSAIMIPGLGVDETCLGCALRPLRRVGGHAILGQP